MSDREKYMSLYRRLRKKKKAKPYYAEFLRAAKVHHRRLGTIFGSNPYSKLQAACGDSPNKLALKRTPLSLILDQYGALVRQQGALPGSADWNHARYSPNATNLMRVHNLKWQDMPSAFIKDRGGKKEWQDVVDLLRIHGKEKDSHGFANKRFNDVLHKIEDWRPDRKRIVEEGYKIELRHYLERHYKVEEECGESNADLVVMGCIPIEVKKDPSVSEYDRLMGQLLRHHKVFGCVVCVVTGITSQDRFRRFSKLFAEVRDKTGMVAEVMSK